MSALTTFQSKADPGIGRESAPVGSRLWAERVRLDMQGVVGSIEKKPQAVKFYVDLVKKHQAWTLMNRPDGSFFKTFEEFCEHRSPWGLGRPWSELRLYIVAAFGGNEAAVEAMTTTAEAAPTHAEATAKQPRTEDGRKLAPAQTSVGDDGNEQTKPENSRGNDSSYLAARIARDAPEVHERMKAGEFPSVRAAAIEAGVVKPKAKSTSALAVAQAAFLRLTALERAEFEAWAHALRSRHERM